MNQNDFLCNRKGIPVFLTGLQCHNSSSGTEMIERTIAAIKLYGGNVLEAPIYWCEVEAVQDSYDMSLVKALVDQAREAGLYLIPLWFGASKNGLMTYAPDYVKKNPKRYRLARDAAQIALPSLTPHCRETLIRDKKAFAEVMEFLASYDREGTVIAVQIENEVGLAGTDRDYGEAACEEFEQAVPPQLWEVKLADSGVSCDEKCPSPKEATWKAIFGRHGNEAFCAWKHACYIQEMVEAGEEKLRIPYLMNVSIEINSCEEPGLCYISGGPVSRVLDIYKIMAPGIRLFGPDIYLPAERDFRKACAAYARADNPLFIPESPYGGMGAALNLFLAAAEYHAIGICCFGAESGFYNNELLPAARPVAASMKAISSLAPLLIKYHRSGRIYAVTQAEFSEWQYVKTKEYHIVASFISTNPGLQHYYGSRINVNAPQHASCFTERGRCLIIDCGLGEFYVAGLGVCLAFLKRPAVEDKIPYAHVKAQLSGQLHFLSIEEGHFEEDRWVCEYKRNGDEANYQLYIHEGQVVRVRLNTNLEWEG